MSIEHSDIDRELESIERRWEKEERSSPPDLLDQAVLNAARRAIPERRRSPIRWVGGLATASVAVLAISLVLLQEPVPPSKVDSKSADIAESPAEGMPVQAESLEEARRDMDEAPVAAPRRRDMFKASEAAPADRMAVTAMADQVMEADSPTEPETWLTELLQLHEQGSHEALVRELESFRTAYPEFELPPVLQDFAEQLPDQP